MLGCLSLVVQREKREPLNSPDWHPLPSLVASFFKIFR